jgi:hypothetical protein
LIASKETIGRNAMNRSNSLMTSALLAAVLLAGTPARAEDKVQFRLNWILYGFHTPSISASSVAITKRKAST